MRRVLVPLDGSDLSATILDDAVRLAGRYGALILMQAVSMPRGRSASPHSAQVESEAAQEYLETVAEGLRARNVSVSTLANVTLHVADAIERAAIGSRADMIASATHSRGVIGRLVWGSVAWQVLAHSPVPVLLRHPQTTFASTETNEHRRILVPIDGSDLSRTALPLAETLAAEWQAPIDLVQVITAAGDKDEVAAAHETLNEIVKGKGNMRAHVVVGDTVDELIAFAQGAHVTDVVTASHGRSGLARAFLGAIAYDLIHRLPLPVFVVPALAVKAEPETEVEEAHERELVSV